MVDKKKQGRANRRKGGRVEREIVNEHKALGVHALRVPLSGAATGFKGDIKIADAFTAEVKSRKGGAGFKTLEGWLGDNDMLFLHRDRQKPLAVMPWKIYVMMIEAYSSSVQAEEEGETGLQLTHCGLCEGKLEVDMFSKGNPLKCNCCGQCYFESNSEEE